MVLYQHLKLIKSALFFLLVIFLLGCSPSKNTKNVIRVGLNENSSLDDGPLGGSIVLTKLLYLDSSDGSLLNKHLLSAYQVRSYDFNPKSTIYNTLIAKDIELLDNNRKSKFLNFEKNNLQCIILRIVTTYSYHADHLFR